MGTFAINATVIAICMLVVWLISLRQQDASIVDPFWGTGFVIVAWVSLFVNLPGSFRIWLLTVMITVWGVRLSVFLFWRNLGKGEDPRYVAMRKKHGARFWWVSLLTVFLLQGIIMWLVALPIQQVAAADNASTIGFLGWIGVAIWAIGLFFETVGDWQLARFRSNLKNKGKVLDSGLWKYTRHPNYFGDFCIWWGVYLVAFSGGAAWTIVSPLLMSLFLLKVSGVKLLEKDISNRRPDYEEYKRRTSSFFPWPPRV